MSLLSFKYKLPFTTKSTWSYPIAPRLFHQRRKELFDKIFCLRLPKILHWPCARISLPVEKCHESCRNGCLIIENRNISVGILCTMVLLNLVCLLRCFLFCFLHCFALFTRATSCQSFFWFSDFSISNQTWYHGRHHLSAFFVPFCRNLWLNNLFSVRSVQDYLDISCVVKNT